jgi:hypothetical protein
VKLGDLVEVYGHDARGENPDDHRISGILMGWDSSDEGWILLVSGQLEVYPRTWWRCEVVSESR